MKYRYYYKGEPLAEYCRKHKINVNTITSNINKKQNTRNVAKKNK